MKSLERYLDTYPAGQDYVMIRRSYIDLLQDTNAALVLSECDFWTGKNPYWKDEGWFYRTDQEWKERTALSRYMVKKAVDRIKDELPGVLETVVMKVGNTPVTHYRINRTELAKIIDRLTRKEEVKARFESSVSSSSVQELIRHFGSITGIDPAGEDPAKVHIRWVVPASRMLGLVGNLRDAKQILEEAINTLRANSMQCPTPSSAWSTFTTVYADQGQNYTEGELKDFVIKG